MEEIVTREELERCHQRWHCLFFGVWRALNKHNDNLTWGLLEALKKCGLTSGKTFLSDLFEQIPTEETLRKVKDFCESATIPNLKGKVHPWKELDPLGAFFNYSFMLGIFDDLPSFRQQNPRVLAIKNRLKAIIPLMMGIKRQEVPDRLLREWAFSSKRQLAINITSHLYNKTPDNFQKLLTKARRIHPNLTKAMGKGSKPVKSG
jgi:hypothetical protein